MIFNRKTIFKKVENNFLNSEFPTPLSQTFRFVGLQSDFSVFEYRRFSRMTLKSYRF